jgi:hypothetical protein
MSIIYIYIYINCKVKEMIRNNILCIYCKFLLENNYKFEINYNG